MPESRLLRDAFARLGFVAALALACVFAIFGPRLAHAEWKSMNADIDATNFIVKAGPVGDPKGLCTGTLISKQYKLVLTADHCLTDNIDV